MAETEKTAAMLLDDLAAWICRSDARWPRSCAWWPRISQACPTVETPPTRCSSVESLFERQLSSRRCARAQIERRNLHFA